MGYQDNHRGPLRKERSRGSTIANGRRTCWTFRGTRTPREGSTGSTTGRRNRPIPARRKTRIKRVPRRLLSPPVLMTSVGNRAVALKVKKKKKNNNETQKDNALSTLFLSLSLSLIISLPAALPHNAYRVVYRVFFCVFFLVFLFARRHDSVLFLVSFVGTEETTAALMADRFLDAHCQN